MKIAPWQRISDRWHGARLDTVVALVYLLVALPLTAVIPAHGAHVRQVDALGYALVVLSAVGIAWRRRWPWRAFTAAALAVLISAGREYPGGPLFVPVIVTLYTLAVIDTRARSLGAGVVLLAGQLAVQGLFRHGGWFTKDVLTAPAPVAAALFLGWAVSSRQAQLAEESRRRLDAERLRIARELHDVVAHSIATINIQAGVAAHVIDKQPEQAAEALRAIKSASKDALREMRGILGLLRQSDELEQRAPAPGLDQLDLLVTSVSAAGLQTRIDFSGRRRALPSLVDLAAYRIIQESLTNTLRHAGPASAHVSIAYRDDQLVIDIDDDGRSGGNGAHPVHEGGSGLGITGMRERAGAVGGRLEAGPRLEGGFHVHASLPLTEKL